MTAAVLRTVDEIVLDSFCFSTAVAGAGVVQRYLVQIILESAFSEWKSVREDFCRSRLEKYSISADDIWLDVVEVSSSCLVVLCLLPQLVDVSVDSTVKFMQFKADVDVLQSVFVKNDLKVYKLARSFGLADRRFQHGRPCWSKNIYEHPHDCTELTVCNHVLGYCCKEKQ